MAKLHVYFSGKTKAQVERKARAQKGSSFVIEKIVRVKSRDKGGIKVWKVTFRLSRRGRRRRRRRKK